MSPAIKRAVLPLAGFALFLGVWWLVAVSGLLGAGQLPRPDQVFVTVIDRFAGDGLWRDVQLSVLRVLIGVGIGCAAAVPVGFVLAWYPTLRSMFEPLVNFFRALPPIALIPLVILYMGIGRSEEHTSELQSRGHLVCRLLLEKKN